jgi:putative endonuclease
MFFVYVLADSTGSELYSGYTNNLKKRLEEHNRGGTHTTKGKLWKCIYYEACLNKKDALRREHYLKTTQGKRLLKLRLKEYFFIQKTTN